MVTTANPSKRTVDDLYEAVLSLRTADEARKFFRDLLTIEEINELSGRWRVVQMIDAGTPYRTIAEDTGVSTATITRVAHWLKYGQGGYRLALDRRKRKGT